MVDLCAVFNANFGNILKHDGFRSGKGEVVLVDDDVGLGDLAVVVFVQDTHNLKMLFNQMMLIDIIILKIMGKVFIY